MKKGLFASLLSLGLILTACAEGEEPKKVDKEEVQKEEGKKEEVKKETFKVGDTVEFKDARYTLKEVSKTEERNEFEEKQPTAVIKIEYEVENLSDSDLSFGMDASVYDASGNKMESYPLDNDMGSIAPGKKAQVKEFFSIDELGLIEIHIAPMISFDKAAIFEVEIN